MCRERGPRWRTGCARSAVPSRYAWIRRPRGHLTTADRLAAHKPRLSGMIQPARQKLSLLQMLPPLAVERVGQQLGRHNQRPLDLCLLSCSAASIVRRLTLPIALVPQGRHRLPRVITAGHRHHRTWVTGSKSTLSSTRATLRP